jgi:hypothetical protein
MSEMISLQSEKSPLARLVLFMVCLSVAGSIVAGVHYYTVDLPQQQNVQAPANEQGICGACCRYGQCLVVNSRKTCDAIFEAYKDELQYCPE